MPSDVTSRYSRTAVFLHWLVAALVAIQVPLGWAMQAIAKSPPGARADAFNLHKSFGMTIAVLVLVRLAWRAGHRPPAWPAHWAWWQQGLALANHAALYVLLLGMATTGYLGSAFSGYPVRYFGVVLPSWAARDDALKAFFSSAHEVMAWLLVAAFVLHVAGAVVHWRRERGSLAGRMR